MVQTMAKWIEIFPGWQGAPVQLGKLCQQTGSIGLFTGGIQVLEEKRDILGSRKEYCRHSFVLRFNAPAFDRDGFTILVDFQHWVQQQNALGLAPRLGDIPEQCRIRASKGKQERTDGAGAATYSVELTVDYIKLYEVK